MLWPEISRQPRHNAALCTAQAVCEKRGLPMNGAHSDITNPGNRLLILGFYRKSRCCSALDVAFRIPRFAFAAYFAPHNDYLGLIKRAARPTNAGRSV